jgi:hypothetical protein
MFFHLNRCLCCVVTAKKSRYFLSLFQLATKTRGRGTHAKALMGKETSLRWQLISVTFRNEKFFPCA